jgi:hypothetical protein
LKLGRLGLLVITNKFILPTLIYADGENAPSNLLKSF